MSRKIKIKTEKPVLKNTSFTATATPYQLLDEEAQIKEAIVKNERNEKERKLLEKELEKPFGQRNKAVVNKYTAANPEVLNGYPKDVTTGALTLTATALDDPGVPMAQRPVPYFRIIEIKNEGNLLTFKFPIKKETSIDGEEVFKIDNHDVFIDSNGDILQSISEEGSPYEILYNLINGDSDLAEPYAVAGGRYNFTFPGFLVKYTRTKPEPVNTKAPAVVARKQKITYFKDKYPPGAFKDEAVNLRAKTLFDDLHRTGVDVSPVDVVDKAIFIDEMFLGVGRAQVRLFYLELAGKGFIKADMVSGDTAAKDYLVSNSFNELDGVKVPKSNLKKVVINQIFEQNNRNVVADYLDRNKPTV